MHLVALDRRHHRATLSHEGEMFETALSDWQHPIGPDGTSDPLVLVSAPIPVAAGEMMVTLSACGDAHAQAVFVALISTEGDAVAALREAVERNGAVWHLTEDGTMPERGAAPHVAVADEAV